MKDPRADGATLLRARVMELRIRLERVATAAYRRSCGVTGEIRHTEISLRLLFLLTAVERDDFAQAYQLVRLGRHVYQQTSDVLHGRLAMVNLPDVVVDEWAQVVADLEAHLRRRGLPVL